MRRAWILVYEHPPGTSVPQMSRLRRRLFGYRDQSNYRRYEYERKGLLSGTDILHLRRGVVVVPLPLGEVARLLVTEEKARAWLRKVELEPEDLAKMSQAARGQRRKKKPRQPQRKPR